MMTRSGETVITVTRKALLTKLQANRKKHEAEYKKAMLGFREVLTKTLADLIRHHKEGKKIDMYTLHHLPVPESHVAEYEKVIRMMTMSVDRTISLSEAQFSKYIDDDWDWKATFSGTTQRYAGGLQFELDRRGLFHREEAAFFFSCKNS